MGSPNYSHKARQIKGGERKKQEGVREAYGTRSTNTYLKWLCGLQQRFGSGLKKVKRAGGRIVKNERNKSKGTVELWRGMLNMLLVVLMGPRPRKGGNNA